MLRRVRLWWRWRRVIRTLTDDECTLLSQAINGNLHPAFLLANRHNRVVSLMFQRWGS